MKIIKEKISIKELKKMAEEEFGSLIKAVVDVDKKIMAIGGAMHADEEALLLKNGSKQESLWGINLYPEAKSKDFKDFIEFDSVINLRPLQGNLSRDVKSAKIRKNIADIVKQLIER